MIPTFDMSDRLRKAREITGLSQEEFAEHAGISRATIGNAESGRKTPHKSTVKLWALATGVDAFWILNGYEKSPSPEGEGLSSVVRPKGFEPPTFCSAPTFQLVAA